MTVVLIVFHIIHRLSSLIERNDRQLRAMRRVRVSMTIPHSRTYRSSFTAEPETDPLAKALRHATRVALVFVAAGILLVVVHALTVSSPLF
jgi:hypothetical protein